MHACMHTCIPVQKYVHTCVRSSLLECLVLEKKFSGQNSPARSLSLSGIWPLKEVESGRAFVSGQSKLERGRDLAVAAAAAAAVAVAVANVRLSLW